MKSHAIIAVAFVSAVALAGVVAAVAQQANPSATNPNNTNSDSATAPATTVNTATRTAESNSTVSKLDSKTSNATVRASKLIGTNLKNSNDESVGEIKDLVIDARSGKVRYAAVTYGGLFGLGSKLFAVPFEAFRVRQNTSALTPGDYVLTLDVGKEQLSGAEGFDSDHWPDFANTNFTQELDRRYKVHRSQTLR